VRLPGRVWRSLGIRLTAEGTYGLPDPALTGFCEARRWSTGLGRSLRLRPDFLRPCLIGSGELAGRLLTFGFGAGSGEGRDERQGGSGSGGGGARLAAKAVVVVRDGDVTVFPLGRGIAIDKIIEAIPGVLEKVNVNVQAGGKGKDKEKHEAE